MSNSGAFPNSLIAIRMHKLAVRPKTSNWGNWTGFHYVCPSSIGRYLSYGNHGRNLQRIHEYRYCRRQCTSGDPSSEMIREGPTSFQPPKKADQVSINWQFLTSSELIDNWGTSATVPTIVWIAIFGKICSGSSSYLMETSDRLSPISYKKILNYCDNICCTSSVSLKAVPIGPLSPFSRFPPARHAWTLVR